MEDHSFSAAIGYFQGVELVCRIHNNPEVSPCFWKDLHMNVCEHVAVYLAWASLNQTCYLKLWEECRMDSCPRTVGEG